MASGAPSLGPANSTDSADPSDSAEVVPSEGPDPPEVSEPGDGVRDRDGEGTGAAEACAEARGLREAEIHCGEELSGLALATAFVVLSSAPLREWLLRWGSGDKTVGSFLCPLGLAVFKLRTASNLSAIAGVVARGDESNCVFSSVANGTVRAAGVGTAGTPDTVTAAAGADDERDEDAVDDTAAIEADDAGRTVGVA